MSFLTIDPETKLPTIDKNAEIFQMKEFLVLLKRNNPSDGDSDGRKKLMNLKEFCYIWFHADPLSYGVKQGYDPKQLDNEARKLYDIPTSWKADKEVYAAIDLYRKQYDDLSFRIYNTLAKSFNSVDRIANKLIDSINLQLDIDINEFTPENIGSLISCQKELLTMVDSIPKKLKDLKEAEALVKQDMDSSEKGRGGKVIRKSFDD